MTSFWRNNDVIITPCVRWDVARWMIKSKRWCDYPMTTCHYLNQFSVSSTTFQSNYLRENSQEYGNHHSRLHSEQYYFIRNHFLLKIMSILPQFIFIRTHTYVCGSQNNCILVCKFVYTCLCVGACACMRASNTIVFYSHIGFRQPETYYLVSANYCLTGPIKPSVIQKTRHCTVGDNCYQTTHRHCQ